MDVQAVNGEKPKISSSHLALRFYRSSGWTYDMLKSCLAKGELRCSSSTFGDSWDYAYWALDHQTHAAFDVDKLLEVAGDLYDYLGNKLEGDEKRDYISKMNW
jgi:hypothetical protein